MMKALLLYDRQSVDYQGQNLSVRAAAAARAVGCELTTQMLDGDRMRPCRGCPMLGEDARPLRLHR